MIGVLRGPQWSPDIRTSFVFEGSWTRQLSRVIIMSGDKVSSSHDRHTQRRPAPVCVRICREPQSESNAILFLVTSSALWGLTGPSADVTFRCEKSLLFQGHCKWFKSTVSCQIKY